MKSRSLVGILVLSFLGIADAWYLANAAITGTALSCDLNTQLSGCNIVAQSAYAQLFGVPLGVYGVIFYAGVFIVSAIYLLFPYRTVFYMLCALAVLGFLASLVFVYVQVFLIHAVCIYCLGSALIDVLIFALVARMAVHTDLLTPGSVRGSM